MNSGQLKLNLKMKKITMLVITILFLAGSAFAIPLQWDVSQAGAPANDDTNTLTGIFDQITTYSQTTSIQYNTDNSFVTVPVDADGDGVPDDADGDGYSASCGDCMDEDPMVSPEGMEIPGNSIDEDCNSEFLCDPEMTRTTALSEYDNINECVVSEAKKLKDEGLISGREYGEIISGFHKENKGKKK